MTAQVDDDVGAARFSLIFCNINNYDEKDTIVIGGSLRHDLPGRTFREECPDNSFIDGMRTRFCGAGGQGNKNGRCRPTDSKDQIGIMAVEISCKPLGGDPDLDRVVLAHCKNDSIENTNDCSNDSQWDEWKFIPPAKKGSDKFFGIVGANAQNGPCCDDEDDVDDLGVVGIQLLYKESYLPGANLRNGAVTYEASWKGKGTRPSAIFATAIHGDVGQNEHDEDMVGIHNANMFHPTIGMLNNVPFVLSNDISSPGVIAMSRFNEVINNVSSSSILYHYTLFLKNMFTNFDHHTIQH